MKKNVLLLLFCLTVFMPFLMAQFPVDDVAARMVSRVDGVVQLTDTQKTALQAVAVEYVTAVRAINQNYANENGISNQKIDEKKAVFNTYLQQVELLLNSEQKILWEQYRQDKENTLIN